MSTDLTAPAEALVKELEKRQGDYLATLQRSDPQHNPRASNIHECTRNIVYQVLDWDKKKTFEPWLLARFEEGRRQEQAVISRLMKMGFEIIQQDVNGQLTIAVPEQSTNEFRRGEVLTGRIDGLIKWEDHWLPFEVKSVHPNMFNDVNTIADFEKKPIYRRYLKQLEMYMLGRNSEIGLYIMTDCLGHDKFIPFYLDFGRAELILRSLETAARAIKKREYPDRIPYDNRLCGSCQFAHICLPDVINKPADMIDNEVLEADLSRHEELKPLASEFDKLHDVLKATFKGIPKALVGGRFLVQSVPSKRMVYELPDEIVSQIADLKKGHGTAVPVEIMSIEDLEKKTQGASE